MHLQEEKKITQRTDLASVCITESECQLEELSILPWLIFMCTLAYLQVKFLKKSEESNF